MALCFVKNREKIEKLIEEIDNFRGYSNESLIEIDKRANMLSVMFLIFITFGILFYISVPFITKSYCESHKTQDMIEYGIPCGVMERYRFPFRFDYTPLYEILVSHQIMVVLIVSFVVVTITMLICGAIYHTIRQFQILKRMILEISTRNDDEIVRYLQHVIKFHNAIIRFDIFFFLFFFNWSQCILTEHSTRQKKQTKDTE